MQITVRGVINKLFRGRHNDDVHANADMKLFKFMNRSVDAVSGDVFFMCVNPRQVLKHKSYPAWSSCCFFVTVE